MTSPKTSQHSDTFFNKKRPVKYLIVAYLFCMLTAPLSILAQQTPEEKPVNQRDISFLYCEFGLQNSTKVNILVITSYLYRYKYNDGYDQPVLSSSSLQTMLLNAFNQKVNAIQKDEYNKNAERYSKQIMSIPHSRIISSFYNGTTAEGFCPVTTYDVLTSTTLYLNNCREKIIEDYRSRGYTIFQVDFSDYYDDDLLKAGLENVNKLSSLYIDEYHVGSLMRIAAPFQNLIGAKSPIKHSDDDDVAQFKLKMYNAGLYEVEGDRLYKMGGLFYAEAIKNYQTAQSIFYNDRVKQKIDNINNTIATVKAIDDGMNKLNDNVNKAVANLDPNEKTKFSTVGVSYEGLAGKYDKITNTNKQSPYAAFIGFTGHRVCISVETRIGFIQSPVYEYNIERNNGGNETLVDKVAIQQQGIGGGLSLGLNLPIKRRVLLYGLCGFDIGPLTLNKSIVSDGAYMLKDSPDFPFLNFKLSIGMDFIIPKTSVGIGARYNLNNIAGIKDSASEITNSHDSNTSNHYYLKSTTDANYKYNNVGIRFFWLVK